MQQEQQLNSILPGKVYTISRFAEAASDYAIKLSKMGFIEGTAIELASVNLADPMVFDIRGSRIALRKNEANEIFVKEVKQ